LSELEGVAGKGNASAHYVLALYYSPDNGRGQGSEHWYNLEKQGRTLIGIEKEWADQFAKNLLHDEKYEFHLREASKLGNEDALLDLADKFGDPSFFEQVRSINHDPTRAANIAENLEHIAGLKHWLTIGAEKGHIWSIIRLIEDLDSHDLQRCWTWIYFAQMLGTDLAEDDYYAIHEDGSLYDDDIGGAMYVDGRDGINLAPLSEEQDSAARQKAQALFENIQ
jgi:TPR repeat protein